MRVIGYIRVSSEGQVRDGFGLDAQEHKIRTHAEREGLELVDIARDEARSGGDGLEHRVGLAVALQRIEEGEAEALLITELSRLARDVVLQEVVIGQLIASNHQVISVAEPDLCTNDPYRKAFRQMVGVWNEFYKGMLKLQMRGGKEAKRRRDPDAYWGGNPRFGTHPVDRELAPREDEMEVLAYMLGRRSQGASLERIAGELNAQGIPTRTPGARWHAWTVSRILTRAQEGTIPSVATG